MLFAGVSELVPIKTSWPSDVKRKINIDLIDAS
jgi:hypothetical protein